MPKPEKISVEVHQGQVLDYETKKESYFLRLLVVWILTGWVALKKMLFGPKLKTNTFWFDGISPLCRKIKENAASWIALEMVYTFVPTPKKDWSGKITNFWSQILNVQAARNRLKLVKFLLREVLEELITVQPTQEIRILSIAAGSARGIIETVAELKKEKKGMQAKIMCLDLNPTALQYSKDLSKEYGLQEQIIFVNRSTTDLKEVASDFRPHIVEMIGFMDYKLEEKAISLLKRIREIMAPGGVLLVGQIAPNSEMFFLPVVVDWPLIYRTPRQFVEIIIKAGFSPENCKILYEPLKVHGIAACKKPR